MAKLLANHPMQGDFVVNVTEGVITAATRPEDRDSIKTVTPEKDADLVSWLNSQRSVLTLNPIDIYADEDEPAASGDGQP